MALWLTVLSYAAALLGVAVAAAYVYLGRKHDYWKRRGVKHLTPQPFVGNMKDVAFMRKNIGIISKEIYDEHKKEPFIGIYSFAEPALHVHDLNLVRAVLAKDFQYFTDRNFEVNKKVDDLGSRSLFALKGDRWRHTRNALTPSFTSGKMKKMYEIIDGRGKALVETLFRENKGEPITMYELAARYTTDVIASCAFGIDSGTLKDPRSEFRRKLRMIFEFTPIEAVKMLFAFISPELLETFNIRLMKQEVEDYIVDTINATINHREQNGIKRNDLLDSLIALMRKGFDDTEENSENAIKNKITLDEVDVSGHAFTFLGAGFETSATTMSYALYELSKNKEIQDKLRDEIHKIFEENGGTIPYDALQSMKYLDLVFQETLRKYPPVPFLDRRCVKPYKVPGSELVLEKGTLVMIPVLGIHRDPEFYPNPMKFIPERFTEENKASQPSCAHIPFGEGPRTCVGLRFALMQAKIGIAYILKDHSVHLPSATPSELDFTPKSFLLQPMKHVQLEFQRLKN